MFLNYTLRIFKNIFFLIFFFVIFYLVNFKFGNLTNLFQNNTQLFFNFVLFLLTVIYFVSFYLSKKTNLIIFISIFLFYVFVLFLEAFLHYNSLKFVKGDFEEKKKLYKSLTGNTFDDRSKFEFYKNLKKNYPKLSVPITVGMVSSNHIFKKTNIFPLSGMSNTKTVHCNENGYFTNYDSDRFGFNNNDLKWDTKNKNKVILLGDSFVHGACVFRKDSISGLLENSNSNITFYNLAYSEHGPLEQLATLKEYSGIIEPSYIIWFYYEGNDLADLSGALKNKFMIRYLDDINYSQDLPNNVNLADQIYDNILSEQLNNQKIEFNSYTFNYKSLIKLSYLRKVFLNSFIKPKVPIDKFEQITKQISELSKKYSAKLIVVYLPDFSRYHFKKHNDKNFLNYERILNIFEKYEIDIVDINKELFLTLENKKSLFPFEKFGHYNEKGYKLITQILNEKIFNN